LLETGGQQGWQELFLKICVIVLCRLLLAALVVALLRHVMV
jgi:hypothetical protein